MLNKVLSFRQILNDAAKWFDFNFGLNWNRWSTGLRTDLFYQVYKRCLCCSYYPGGHDARVQGSIYRRWCAEHAWCVNSQVPVGAWDCTQLGWYGIGMFCNLWNCLGWGKRKNLQRLTCVQEYECPWKFGEHDRGVRVSFLERAEIPFYWCDWGWYHLNMSFYGAPTCLHRAELIYGLVLWRSICLTVQWAIDIYAVLLSRLLLFRFGLTHTTSSVLSPRTSLPCWQRHPWTQSTTESACYRSCSRHLRCLACT